MNKPLLLAGLLALALVAPPAGAESATYGPVVGVWASPVGGGAFGVNQAVLTAAADFTTVTISVADDLSARTYFTACIERGTLANVCSRSDGDISVGGFDTVTVTDFGTLPAGTTVTVFVHTLGVHTNGTVGVGTTGTATATFS